MIEDLFYNESRSIWQRLRTLLFADKPTITTSTATNSQVGVGQQETFPPSAVEFVEPRVGTDETRTHPRS